MSVATATEYVLLLAAGDPATPQALPELSQLSPREQELVTLVARGSTNAQIAASCTSASAPSARTWTGSGTRPAVGAALT